MAVPRLNRALYAECQQYSNICGKQLTSLLVQAGPNGTAGAGNGRDPRSLNATAGQQLLANSVDISAILLGIKANAAVGKMGERATQDLLEQEGYKVQTQVTFRTAAGAKGVVDFISRDGDGNLIGWEVKTGNGRLEGGQLKLYNAIADGELVYPEGKNAERIGLQPGVGVSFELEFDIWDRPENW